MVTRRKIHLLHIVARQQRASIQHMANKQPVVLRYLSGVISLLVGTSIYLIWRPSSLFNGVDYMPWVRQALPSPPLWLINTMPDALWFAALLCFQTPLKRNFRPVLTIIACCIGPLHEMLQGVKIVPGTFCWQDLITYFTIIIIYFIICLNPFSKKRDKRFQQSPSLHSWQ